MNTRSKPSDPSEAPEAPDEEKKLAFVTPSKTPRRAAPPASIKGKPSASAKKKQAPTKQAPRASAKKAPPVASLPVEDDDEPPMPKRPSKADEKKFGKVDYLQKMVNHYAWQMKYNSHKYSITKSTNYFNTHKENLKKAKDAERHRLAYDATKNQTASSGQGGGNSDVMEVQKMLANSHVAFMEACGEEIKGLKTGLKGVEKKVDDVDEKATEAIEKAEDAGKTAKAAEEKVVEIGSKSAVKMDKISRALQRKGIDLSDDSSANTGSPDSEISGSAAAIAPSPAPATIAEENDDDEKEEAPKGWFGARRLW